MYNSQNLETPKVKLADLYHSFPQDLGSIHAMISSMPQEQELFCIFLPLGEKKVENAFGLFFKRAGAVYYLNSLLSAPSANHLVLSREERFLANRAFCLPPDRAA